MHKVDSLKIRGFFIVILLILMFIVMGGKVVIFNYRLRVQHSIQFFFWGLQDAYLYNQQVRHITSSWSNIKSVITERTVPVQRDQEHLAQAIPVLLYHGIVKTNDRFSITKDNFREHLFALKQAGYETVTLEELEAFLKGEKQLPEKSFVLTFDDGRLDSFLGAQSILKTLDYHAVMFLASGQSLPETPIKNPYYMDENEVKHMVATGNWDVESHAIQQGGGFIPITATGTPGNFLSNKKYLTTENRLETDAEYRERAQAELIKSKSTIEQKLGTKVIAFSYPFGDYGIQTVNYPPSKNIILDTVSSTYHFAFIQVWRGGGDTWNYPEGANRLLLKRIEPDPSLTGQELVAYIEGGRTKNLPYRENFETNKGWRSIWGEVTFAPGELTLKATSVNSGAAVFADGTSEWWKERLFQADVFTKKGETFTLLARFQDDSNFIACVYTNKVIRLEETIQGKRKVLFEYKKKNQLIGTTRKVGIELNDNQAGCFFDGKKVARGTFSSQVLFHGGIGFKSWDPLLENSEIVIKNVYAE